MKKSFFSLIVLIFPVLFSCNNNPNDQTNITYIVEQYVKENNLPITIGEKIIVAHDFSIPEKTNFLFFILDLINAIANKISEGNFNDKDIENYKGLGRIITGFYESCANNGLELALFFETESTLLIEYLEYHNYNFSCNYSVAKK